VAEEVVDHPAHYGGDTPYEVIKVLRAWDLELAKGFCWGNVIKYTQRAGKKDGTIEDRRKASWYARELLSIESELVGKRKATPSEIPVIIPGPGRYHIEIDWEKRTHRLVREDTQFVGGVGGSAATPAGNSGFGNGIYARGGGGAGGGASDENYYPGSPNRG
jgi:hypothetical protein